MRNLVFLFRPARGRVLPTTSLSQNCFSHLFLGRARSDASSVILEQVLGTILDAGRSVRVLSLRVLLPAVLDGVVALHRGTLLLADAVVVEVPASLEVVDGDKEPEKKAARQAVVSFSDEDTRERERGRERERERHTQFNLAPTKITIIGVISLYKTNVRP